MALVWWGEEKPIIGSMNDFNFTQSADDPHHIKYSFKYTGIPIELPKIKSYFKDQDLSKR